MVARQIHTTGVETWLNEIETERELPFVKFFEDGFKPTSEELEERSELTPKTNLVESPPH